MLSLAYYFMRLLYDKAVMSTQGNRIKIALSLGYGCTRLFFKDRRSPCSGSLQT